MHIDFLSLFPKVFSSYLETSILARANAKGIVAYRMIDIRDFSHNSHRTVDDAPYGGGAGMVMKVEPVDEAVSFALGNTNRKKSRVILLSAKGRLFTQKDAIRLSRMEKIILVCGRYQGVDERVAQYVVDEELSIGEYVLTGGELPALVICDAIVRLLPGVLGNAESLEEESYGEEIRASHPLYTRPEEYRGWRVPDVLLGGNHAEIERFRKTHRSIIS